MTRRLRYGHVSWYYGLKDNLSKKLANFAVDLGSQFQRRVIHREQNAAKF